MKRTAKLLVCLGLVWGSSVQASTLSFSCITSNAAGDCAIGQSQLLVDVTGTTQGVSFTFKNNVGFQSSITDIYFDASLSSLSAVPSPTMSDSDGAAGTGVDFAFNANPSNLPGGNLASPAFNASTTTVFTADSNSGAGGVVDHGVNLANEWLTLDYSLQSGRSLNDVLTELSNGNLRLGIHVQGFSSGSSESFVNDPGLPPSSIPVPAAAWLLGSGLLGLVGVARRKAV